MTTLPLAPLACALFVWWAGTGLVLLLDGLPRSTFRWSVGGAVLAALAALAGLVHSGADPTPAGAYQGFVCAVVIWGAHELAFLTGLVTGPRQRACGPACAGWRHFAHACEAILYHELALVANVLALLAIAHDAPNPTGAWTFAAMYALRLSAKLNLFLGVPNVGADFLPERLRYLECYLRQGPASPLLPLSLVACSAIATVLLANASAPGATPFESVSLALLGSFVALAAVEHAFMVLPLRSIRLWQWSPKPARAQARIDETAAVRTPPPEPRSGV